MTKNETATRWRRVVGILILSPIWLPLLLLSWCAGIVWTVVVNGFLWGLCDAEGKTPEERFSK